MFNFPKLGILTYPYWAIKHGYEDEGMGIYYLPSK